MIFLILLFIFFTFILNLIFVKKIKYRRYRVCVRLLNVMVCSIFTILILCLSFVQNKLDNYLDIQIVKLEKNIDELYPGIMTTEIDIGEIKSVLSKSFSHGHQEGLLGLSGKIIDKQIKKYTNPVLSVLGSVGSGNDKILMKDAVFSIKDLSVKSISRYLSIILFFIVFLYAIYIVFVILFSNYFSENHENNKSIVFGENIDISSGMKIEND